MRSFTQDRSVTQQKLAKGTVKRIARFATAYRKLIVILLVLLAVDAAIGVVNPLLFKAIIDRGILRGESRLVVVLAIVAGVIAVFDATLSLVERYFSSRIGEGLIFDMRARIFAHIQRMPIAFFTRTQTGALISRLNNDVLGAQQAFTSTLSSVVSNVLGVSFTPPIHYSMTGTEGLSPAVSDFFQNAEAPFRLGLGVGWIPNRLFSASAGLYVFGATPEAA